MERVAQNSSDVSTKGCGQVALILVVLVAILVSVTDDEDKPVTFEGSSKIAVPIEGPTARETLPANAAAPEETQVKRASLHAGRAIGALGGEGATFYSQRCYESLERRPVPAALDRCYAFDLFAERLFEADNTAYFYSRFWPDNARERWDEQAVRLGIPPDSSTARRQALEKLAEGMEVERIAPPPPLTVVQTEITEEGIPDEVEELDPDAEQSADQATTLEENFEYAIDD